MKYLALILIVALTGCATAQVSNTEAPPARRVVAQGFAGIVSLTDVKEAATTAMNITCEEGKWIDLGGQSVGAALAVNLPDISKIGQFIIALPRNTYTTLFACSAE